MPWPFRVIQMHTHQTIILAEPGWFTVLSLFAVVGVVATVELALAAAWRLDREADGE